MKREIQAIFRFGHVFWYEAGMFGIALGLGLVAVFLAGCSALEQPSGTVESRDEVSTGGTAGELPSRFQLHDVPHNPRRQEGTDCAPDSLRMVLSYRGKKISKDWDIPRKITGHRSARGGTTLHQMQEIAAGSYGLPAFVIGNLDLDSLKAAIVNRWPPIVAYRIAGKSYHAVLAVGYDDRRRTLLVHDPNFLRIKKIQYSDLGGMSKGSGQRLACLLVLPEGTAERDLRRGLEKYVPKEVVSSLKIFGMLPISESQ